MPEKWKQRAWLFWEISWLFLYKRKKLGLFRCFFWAKKARPVAWPLSAKFIWQPWRWSKLSLLSIAHPSEIHWHRPLCEVFRPHDWLHSFSRLNSAQLYPAWGHLKAVWSSKVTFSSMRKSGLLASPVASKITLRTATETFLRLSGLLRYKMLLSEVSARIWEASEATLDGNNHLIPPASILSGRDLPSMSRLSKTRVNLEAVLGIVTL